MSRDEITVERGPGPLWTSSGTKVDRIFIAETLRGTTTALYTYFIHIDIEYIAYLCFFQN